jgi:hypothetical protein
VFQIPFTTIAAWSVPDQPHINDEQLEVEHDAKTNGREESSSNGGESLNMEGEKEISVVD